MRRMLLRPRISGNGEAAEFCSYVDTHESAPSTDLTPPSEVCTRRREEGEASGDYSTRARSGWESAFVLVDLQST